MQKKFNGKSKSIYVLLVILFIVNNYAQNYLSRNPRIWMIAGDSIESNSVCGILSGVGILITVAFISQYKREGVIGAYILTVSCLILASFPIIILGSFRSVPGLVIHGASLGIIALLSSFIKKIEQHEETLEELASHDALTGLPNRRSLRLHVDKLIAMDTPFALLMIDLDDFKTINDTIGHKYGDMVLKKISDRWREKADSKDYAARLGGDEFVVILDGITNEQELIKSINLYKSIIDEEMVLNSKNFFIRASAGGAFYPSDSDNFDELLSFADVSMYAVKTENKGTVSVFSENHMKNLKRSQEIEEMVTQALAEDSFVLNYQPQYSAYDKKLRGYEVLLRMKSNGNYISPAEFIAEAEKTNLIIQIDKWVLLHAMREFKKDVKLSINISARHLNYGDLVMDVKNALYETGFSPTQLEIEITESTFIESISYAGSVLSGIKEMGVSVALDDFGTGYAALKYLHDLPIDIMKIDKTFIDRLGVTADNEFVQAMIMMGQIMSMEIVAEGIEKEEQLDILKGYNCDYIQGYLWGKPMPYENLK